MQLFCLSVSGKCAKFTEVDKAFLPDWLKDLPTVDSHYCRSNPAYKDKKFLYPRTTIAKLHLEFKEAAKTAGVRPVGITRFREVLHEQKYSVFIPRKDQ